MSTISSALTSTCTHERLATWVHRVKKNRRLLNATSLHHEGDLLLTGRRDEVLDGSGFREDDKVKFGVPNAVPFIRYLNHRMTSNQVSRRA